MKIIKKYLSLRFVFSLLGLGFIGKVLSMIARILITRTIGLEAMSLYSVINPAMVLIITLAQMGLPTAVATLISKNPQKQKSIFISSLFLAVIFSIALMLITILSADLLSSNILKNPSTKLTIFGLALLIPLVSLSSLLKGYFIGIGKVELTTVSSIFEEVGRITFVLIFLDMFVKKGVEYAAFGAMLGVCVGEIAQSLYLIFQSELKLYKKIKGLMRLEPYDERKEASKILQLSFPVTVSKLIGSITYFFEPIIFTNLMIKNGFDISFITIEYGKMTGYVLPLLLMPGFFSVAMANTLIPSMTKGINEKNYPLALAVFRKSLLIILIIGLTFSSIFLIFNKQILVTLYGSTDGYEMVYYLAMPFTLFYFELPIQNALHALGLTKQSSFITITACIVRIISLLVLIPYLGIYAVAISTLSSVLITVLIGIFLVRRQFARQNIQSRCCSHG